MGQLRKMGDLVTSEKVLQETNTYLFQVALQAEINRRKSKKLQTFRNCRVRLINSRFSDSVICQLEFYAKVKTINEYTGTNNNGEHEYVVRKC